MKNWSNWNGWPTQKLDGEGSKVHSNGGRVRKRTTQGWGLKGALKMEVRAQRRTQKEVGLENALPKGWGFKGALKMEVRAQRRTQKELRAQRRTQKEVGLENALPKDEGWNTDLSMLKEKNVLWVIWMYTYLRNIGPHFFMVSFFSLKSCSIGSKLRWLPLLLTRVTSCDLDLWEGFDVIIHLCPSPIISRVTNFARHFP